MQAEARHPRFESTALLRRATHGRYDSPTSSLSRRYATNSGLPELCLATATTFWIWPPSRRPLRSSISRIPVSLATVASPCRHTVRPAEPERGGEAVRHCLSGLRQAVRLAVPCKRLAANPQSQSRAGQAYDGRIHRSSDKPITPDVEHGRKTSAEAPARPIDSALRDGRSSGDKSSVAIRESRISTIIASSQRSLVVTLSGMQVRISGPAHGILPVLRVIAPL